MRAIYSPNLQITTIAGGGRSLGIDESAPNITVDEYYYQQAAVICGQCIQ
jgi:hypothetical protein